MRLSIDYLLANESFRICNFLSTDRFISFCQDRKIETSKKALERLEELGIFYPIARATHWPYQAKVRTVNDRGGYELIGPLAPDEKWEGETKVEHAKFYFGRDDTEEWLREGHLWDPRSRPFEGWDSFRSEDGNERMVSYYSPFQAYELWHRTNHLTRRIPAEFWILDPEEWSRGISQWAEEMLEFSKKHFFRYDIAIVCQILSNRYYPLTQTNQRYFSLSTPRDWDWYKFCNQWEADSTLSEISLEPSDIRRAWEMLVMDAKHCDPLEQWYSLISFTDVEKRNKLKGDALKAQTWYAMEHMLRLFYQDVSNEKLPTPEGPVAYKFVPGAEKPIESNPLCRLEELSNDFTLNPRPVLLLLVEGDGEARVIPEIMEHVFGSSVQVLGIQVVSLRGVGNFDGSKKYDPQGALIRLVDDYHTRGTIVFVILDNEGRAANTKKKLTKAHSIHQSRMVTREDYVVVWNKNIEFDNFTDDDIAQAMSELVGSGRVVQSDQIRLARDSFGKDSGTRIDDIFESVAHQPLNKPLLLSKLADRLSIEHQNSESEPDRPILGVLRRVISLAHQNRPKSSKWHREHLINQGLYGESLEDRPAGADTIGDSGNI